MIADICEFCDKEIVGSPHHRNGYMVCEDCAAGYDDFRSSEAEDKELW